jgi:hypothetical protein
MSARLLPRGLTKAVIRVLQGFSGQGHAARDGAADLGKKATIVLIVWKKGVCFERQSSETANSFSVFDNKVIPVF